MGNLVPKANYSKAKDIEIGKRLKEIQKKYKKRNKDIAEIIMFSSENQISFLRSGKNHLTDQNAGLIAEALGIRKEYVLCMDDYETEAELLYAMKEEERKKVLNAVNYMRSIGYDIQIGFRWTDPKTISRVILGLEQNFQKGYIKEEQYNTLKEEVKKNGYIKLSWDDVANNDLSRLATEENDNNMHEYVFMIIYEAVCKLLTKDDFIKFTENMKKAVNFVFDTNTASIWDCSPVE